jgi:hypothetical protein
MVGVSARITDEAFVRTAQLRTSFLWAALALMCAAGFAHADIVHLRDGRVIEGSLIREGDTIIVRRKLGSIHVHASDVLRIEETADRWDELERLQRQLGNGTADERYRLGVWSREHSFKKQAKRAFLSVLRVDLDHAGARAALGYVRHDGRWITRSDKLRLEGLVEHEGQWLKPEAKAKLMAAQKAKAQAAREARVKAKEDAKLERRERREAKREARRERNRERQLELARARAWDRVTSTPYRNQSWYGYRTGSVLYPYGRGGTCNGYRPYVSPAYRGYQSNRSRGYQYNRNGVYYRRSGLRASGSYKGGNWGLRWRIGY